MFLSGFNYVSFPVKFISYKQKTEIFLAQTRITGHFLFSNLNQQCVTKVSIFITIGRILLAMKQLFPVKLEQHWKKGRFSIILHWQTQDICGRKLRMLRLT